MQSILVITIIGFISAADTSRFKRAEDRERVSVYRRILAGLNSFNRVIIIVIWAIR